MQRHGWTRACQRRCYERVDGAERSENGEEPLHDAFSRRVRLCVPIDAMHRGTIKRKFGTLVSTV